MTLDAAVSAPLGDLDVELSAASGEIVAIVGPNGAGKTTLLRALGGLVEVTRARVVLDGVVLEDTERGIMMPPESRPVGFAFQDYRLFPHLSALENVAFGLRSRGQSRGEALRLASSWLARVDLAEEPSAKPSDLSGGQRQRVALARALATSPRLLLLDEPLSAVDLSARAELRRVLRRSLDSFEGVGLLVTHDPLEAFSLASRMIVLEGGSIVQEGTIAEVTSRPRSVWAAQMIGLNLFRGTGRRGRVEVDPAGTLEVASSIEGEVYAVVAPHSVALHRARPEGSARNVVAGEAEGLDLEGDRVRVRVAGTLPLVAEVTPAAVADLQLGQGGAVWASFKATEVLVYPA